MPRTGDTAAQVELLSPREQEVCRLVGSGHTNAEIARRLEISAKTVESHRKSLMTKLGLRRRVELVRFALEHGLLDSLLAGSTFRYCPTCQANWYLGSAFLSDPAVSFLGYQPSDGGQAAGVLMFKHARCGTNLPCLLEWFQGLTEHPILGESCVVSGQQEEHCLAREVPRSCPLRCVCAFVSRISQIIKDWPKNPAPA